ncbi:MAG: TOBE domain-containing protein, partial [Pseudomonadota bacterium]
LADGTVLPTASHAEGPVTVGIRPEHVRVAPDGPLHVRTTMAEPLGANTLLHGRLSDDTEAFVASLPGVHRHDGLTADLHLAIDPALIHLFDPETGARVET